MSAKTFAQKQIEKTIQSRNIKSQLKFQDINAYSDYSDYFDEAIYSESYNWEGDYSLK